MTTRCYTHAAVDATHVTHYRATSMGDNPAARGAAQHFIVRVLRPLSLNDFLKACIVTRDPENIIAFEVYSAQVGSQPGRAR